MKIVTGQIALNDWESPFGELLITCCLWYEYDLDSKFSQNLTTDIHTWLLDDVELSEVGARKMLRLYTAVVEGFQKKISNEKQEDVIYEFIEYVGGSFFTKIKEAHKVPQVIVNIVKDSVLFILKDSEPAFRRVEKAIGSSQLWLNNLHLAVGTVNTLPEQSDLEEIKKIVKELGGKGNTLTVVEKQKLMIDRPEVNKRYNSLRLRLALPYKNWIRKTVLSKGSDGLMSVQKVEKLLSATDNINMLPKGFDGFLNSQGELFTTEKKKLAGNPGAQPVTINMAYNAKADNTYVLTYAPPGGSSIQKIYTEDYKSTAKQEKFSKVLVQLKRIESSRSKWRKDMLTGRPEAFMVELLYITAARIGSAGSMTGGKPTFGLTTLQRRHVKFNNNSVLLTYLGAKTKGEAKQKHLIKTSADKYRKFVISRLGDLVKGAPKPSSQIFIFNKGKVITPTEINKYIKRVVGDITAHKFRHIRGSILAMELLAEIKRRPKNQQDAEKKFKSVMEKVGKELGHFSGDKVTYTTATTYYVMPEVSQDFFKKFEFRVPKFVPQ